MAERLRLTRDLHRLDDDESAGLWPLLAAEREACEKATAALVEWESARVAAEMAIKLRCTAARMYFERRATILAALHALGPVRPPVRKEIDDGEAATGGDDGESDPSVVSPK